MRGLAALAVAWLHAAFWNKHLPEELFAFGFLGPHVFFIISGFVVPWALWRAGYRWEAGLRFFAKRLVRLEPPYFATIALIISLEWARSSLGADRSLYSVDWQRLAVHVGYLNAFVGMKWYNPVFWTLAIEFQYYVVIALLFPLLCTHDWRVRTLITSGLLATYLPFHGAGNVHDWTSSTPWLLGYLPLFMNGFLLFQRRAGIIGGREFWLWSLILVIPTVGYSRLMPWLALLTVFLLARNSFHTRITGFLGRISYSLYLVHVPVGILFQDRVMPHLTSDGQRQALALVTLALSILAGWVFYRLIERPSLDLSKRIRYYPAARGAAAEPPAAPVPGAGALGLSPLLANGKADSPLLRPAAAGDGRAPGSGQPGDVANAELAGNQEAARHEDSRSDGLR
jgi:peptidoglycan/LPS O-acetylase OafA/YrhL